MQAPSIPTLLGRELYNLFRTNWYQGTSVVVELVALCVMLWLDVVLLELVEV